MRAFRENNQPDGDPRERVMKMRLINKTVPPSVLHTPRIHRTFVPDAANSTTGATTAYVAPHFSNTSCPTTGAAIGIEHSVVSDSYVKKLRNSREN